MTHTIRSVRASDSDAVYDICLRTADAGGDARQLYDDPRLPGHVWAGAYVTVEPDHGFVIADDRDVAIGYVLGARDSRSFEATLEASWWPPLRERYPLDVPRAAAADRIAVHLIHHPSTADDEVVVDHPSHLHIDLLPEAQGAGNGRRLMDRLLGSLADAGSVGVHLGVATRNERAIGFYRAMAFTELVADDHKVIFGRRLA